MIKFGCYGDHNCVVRAQIGSESKSILIEILHKEFIIKVVYCLQDINFFKRPYSNEVISKGTNKNLIFGANACCVYVYCEM